MFYRKALRVLLECTQSKTSNNLMLKTLNIPTAQCTRFTKQNNNKELLNAKSGQPKEHLPLVMRLLITSLMKSCYKSYKINFSHYSSKLKRQESELNSFCKKKQDYFPTALANRLMVLAKVLLKKLFGKIRNKRLMRQQIVLLEIQARFWSLIAKQVFIKVAPKHSFFVSILYYLLQIQLLNDNVIPIL